MQNGWGSPGTPPAGVVLVADDHEPSWRAVQRLLEARDLDARWARDGDEAVAMVAESWFDLVLMDCHMPGLDGWEAARVIRRDEARAGSSRLPVVAVTADALDRTRDRCLAAGMDDYVVKPLRADRLDTVLARWLTAPGSGPVIDHERWAELRAAFSEGELRALLSDLTADVTTQLTHIQSAMPGDDSSEIARAAHQIANSAAILGAFGLGSAARRLCQLADVERADGIREVTAVTAALARRWEHTRAAMAGLDF